MGFTDLLLSACEWNPSGVAVRCGDRVSTFTGHLSRVTRAADVLRGVYGLTPADRFAVLARNSSDYLELFHASLLGAAVIVPLNIRATEAELATILDDCGARVCFASAEFLDVTRRLGGQTALERVVEIGEPGAGYDEQIMQSTSTVPAPPRRSDVAFIMYTSGTTGSPKGVPITHDAMINDIYKTAPPPSLARGRVSLMHSPLFHIASLRGFGVATAVGGTLVLLPRFDPQRIVDEIRTHEVGATGFIASTIPDMLRLPDFCAEALPSLQSISYGSAPMDLHVLRRLMHAFPEVRLTNWYGLTETCGHVSALSDEDHRRGGSRLASVGRPLPGNRVRVVDPSDRFLPPGQVGELWVSGDNVMTGYWNQPPLHSDTDGTVWYPTGDRGYMDEDRYIYLVGRTREMIITGGENVAPAEVESALTDHPAVHQAVVLGVPDPKWGEAVHACVVVPEGVHVDQADLIAHCRGLLAGYKIPKRISIQHARFPMTGSDKIDRKRVKADYLSQAVDAPQH